MKGLLLYCFALLHIDVNRAFESKIHTVAAAELIINAEALLIEENSNKFVIRYHQVNTTVIVYFTQLGTYLTKSHSLNIEILILWIYLKIFVDYFDIKKYI